MPSSMPTWRNYGWLHEPLQNWAVKSPGPKRDIRRHCIVWSRDEMERQREAFERAGRPQSPPQRSPNPTPRYRRYAAPIDPAHAPYLPPGTVRPVPQHARQPGAQPAHARRPLEITASWATPSPPPPHSHGAPHSHAAPYSQAAPSRAATDFATRELLVGLMIVFAPPLGVLVLWSGDRARETKVVTTVVAMMWMTAVTVVVLAGILA